jgi:hypothetical protein
MILFLIEFCWNTYPSTDLSSALLHGCHLILLFGIAKKFVTRDEPATVAAAEPKKKVVASKKSK